MPTYEVRTSHAVYPSIVERGCLHRVPSFLPPKTGKIFAVTTKDVWQLHGERFLAALGGREVEPLFYRGNENHKRLASLEELAEQMVAKGADRSSLVIGFGGGIVTDIAGFLAAIFMRSVPVIQIPTTLLAQVDAAVGGKTGVNLASGKNLIGSFHQPLAVLIDPDMLSTLPEREFRAGLFEVIKCGVIRDQPLFDLLSAKPKEILALQPDLVDQLISAAVRIKAEVVSADEKEGDLRRILNFGHTIGHAIEAETSYVRFLHGEAIAHGMITATVLATLVGCLSDAEYRQIAQTIRSYGPVPSAADLNPDHLLQRLGSDKKTIQGKVHFILPTAIGNTKIVSGIEPGLIRQAIVSALSTQ